MNKILIPTWLKICLVSLLLATVSSALTVIDPTLVRTNLLNAKKDLLEQIKQEANQKTQILRLEHQIMRADDLLRRMGKPGEVDLAMIREIFGFLKRLEGGKTSDMIVKDIDPAEVFRSNPRNGPSTDVSSEIMVDGKVVGKREGQVFAPEVAARRSLDHYRQIKSANLVDRHELKQKIASTLQAVQEAKTSSEVQKLATVLMSLQTQLAASDQEARSAADEVFMRYLHNQNEKEIAAKARVQKQRYQLKIGTEKNLQRYRLPAQPFLFPR